MDRTRRRRGLQVPVRTVALTLLSAAIVTLGTTARADQATPTTQPQAGPTTTLAGPTTTGAGPTTTQAGPTTTRRLTTTTRRLTTTTRRLTTTTRRLTTRTTAAGGTNATNATTDVTAQAPDQTDSEVAGTTATIGDDGGFNPAWLLLPVGALLLGLAVWLVMRQRSAR